MNGNIANGGLVVKWRGGAVFARPNEWFMNADDEYIYYSDRNDENRIYRKGGGDVKGKMVVKKAGAGLTLFGGNLYFVNEDDKNVYRCTKEGKSAAACSNEETAEFAVLEDGGVFIRKNARRTCVAGAKAFFADGGNASEPYALTCLDIRNGETETYPDIKPTFINHHDGNIYFTDANRANRIFRLEPSGARMSVFGGCAAFLHVIDDWLYFFTEENWKRLSLLNFGEAEEA